MQIFRKMNHFLPKKKKEKEKKKEGVEPRGSVDPAQVAFH
jgi:hypothetical protein